MYFTTREQEMDGVLKAHIGMQIFVWGLLFPAGTFPLSSLPILDPKLNATDADEQG